MINLVNVINLVNLVNLDNLVNGEVNNKPEKKKIVSAKIYFHFVQRKSKGSSQTLANKSKMMF